MLPFDAADKVSVAFLAAVSLFWANTQSILQQVGLNSFYPSLKRSLLHSISSRKKQLLWYTIA